MFAVQNERIPAQSGFWKLLKSGSHKDVVVVWRAVQKGWQKRYQFGGKKKPFVKLMRKSRKAGDDNK